MSKSLGCHETFQEISKSVTFQSSDDISRTIENDVTVYSCINSCETSSDDAIVIASSIDPTTNNFRFQENSSVCQSARFHGLVPLEPFKIQKVEYLGGYRPILRNEIESYSWSSGSFAFIINEENSKDLNHFRQKCSKYIDLDYHDSEAWDSSHRDTGIYGNDDGLKTWEARNAFTNNEIFSIPWAGKISYV